MELEVGKKYNRRDGEVVTITQDTKSDDDDGNPIMERDGSPIQLPVL